MVEKVTILEKDFPASIPEDIGHKSIEVVNESGEIIEFFYDISFFKFRPEFPKQFINEYDEIITKVIELENSNMAELVNWSGQQLAFNLFAWNKLDNVTKALIVLCRLFHPLNCNRQDEYYRVTIENTLNRCGIAERGQISSMICSFDEHAIFATIGRVLTNSEKKFRIGVLKIFTNYYTNFHDYGKLDISKLFDFINLYCQNPALQFIERKWLDGIINNRCLDPNHYEDTYTCYWKVVNKTKIQKSDFVSKMSELEFVHSIRGNKPVEVVDDKGDLIALFYDTSFCNQVIDNFDEFVKYFDGIFDYWNVWTGHYMIGKCSNGVGPYFDYQKDEEKYELWRNEQLENTHSYDLQALSNYEYIPASMLALCRLAYPFKLENYEKVEECYKNENTMMYWEYFPKDEFCTQVLEFEDPKIMEKYLDLESIDVDLDRKIRVLKFIDDHAYTEMIYDNPGLYLSKSNIDCCIKYATDSENAELLAFLLDYKNKSIISTIDNNFPLGFHNDN